MTMISRKSPIYSLILTSALFGLSVGCSDDDDQSETYKVISELTVAMEVPPPAGTTTAKGIFAFEFAEKTGVMKYTLTVGDLTGPATAGHIHKGAVGVPGPVVLPLVVPTGTDPSMGAVTLDAAAIADLKAGALYVNVHTAANPMGEIRGQLKINP